MSQVWVTFAQAALPLQKHPAVPRQSRTVRASDAPQPPKNPPRSDFSRSWRSGRREWQLMAAAACIPLSTKTWIFSSSRALLTLFPHDSAGSSFSR